MANDTARYVLDLAFSPALGLMKLKLSAKCAAREFVHIGGVGRFRARVIDRLASDQLLGEAAAGYIPRLSA
jgi:hypothetical protein